MNREEILKAAAKCVCGDREQDYGSPEDNFRTIASMWNSYLYGAGLMAYGIKRPPQSFCYVEDTK